MKNDLKIIKICFILVIIIAAGLIFVSASRLPASARARAHCMLAYDTLHNPSHAGSPRYITSEELSKAPEKVAECYSSLTRDSNELAVKGLHDQIIMFGESLFILFIGVAGLSWTKLKIKEQQV